MSFGRLDSQFTFVPSLLLISALSFATASGQNNQRPQPPPRPAQAPRPAAPPPPRPPQMQRPAPPQNSRPPASMPRQQTPPSTRTPRPAAPPARKTPQAQRPTPSPASKSPARTPARQQQASRQPAVVPRPQTHVQPKIFRPPVGSLRFPNRNRGGATYTTKDGRLWVVNAQGHVTRYSGPGIEARFDERGSIHYVHNQQLGVTVHEGLAGGRQVVVEHHDGTRVVTVGRTGFYETPLRNGYVKRTFVNGSGLSYAQVYQRYNYRGTVLYSYCTQPNLFAGLLSLGVQLVARTCLIRLGLGGGNTMVPVLSKLFHSGADI